MFPTNNTPAPRYTPYTGVDTLIPVCANPTQADLQALGVPATIEPNYELRSDYNGNPVKPLVMYFRAVGANQLVRVNIDLGNTVDVRQSGNYQVVTSDSSIVWAKASGETDVKPEFKNHAGLVKGEADLLVLFKKLLNYSKSSGYNLMEHLVSNKLTAKDLYANGVEMLREFFDFCIENKYCVNTVLSVRESQKNAGKFNQIVGLKLNQFAKLLFSGEANDWSRAAIKSNIEKDPNCVAGLYTIELMPFDRTKVLNDIPSVPEDEAPW